MVGVWGDCGTCSCALHGARTGCGSRRRRGECECLDISRRDARGTIESDGVGGIALVIEPHVIVLEDDAELRSLIDRALREEEFEVTTAATAGEFVRLIAGVEPDALVVDVGLPDADGRDVVQALRAQGVGAPVIFLTARDSLPDRISGFAAGGDDYLTKPFAFAELVVRLRALIRRGGSEFSVDAAGLRLDPASHDAACGGRSVG